MSLFTWHFNTCSVRYLLTEMVQVTETSSVQLYETSRLRTSASQRCYWL